MLTKGTLLKIIIFRWFKTDLLNLQNNYKLTFWHFFQIKWTIFDRKWSASRTERRRHQRGWGRLRGHPLRRHAVERQLHQDRNDDDDLKPGFALELGFDLRNLKRPLLSADLWQRIRSQVRPRKSNVRIQLGESSFLYRLNFEQSQKTKSKCILLLEGFRFSQVTIRPNI